MFDLRKSTFDIIHNFLAENLQGETRVILRCLVTGSCQLLLSAEAIVATFQNHWGHPLYKVREKFGDLFW